MTFWEVVLLITGGLAAGVINTMAGGASALTVPLLVIAGVPGNQANGSNRIGVLAASASSLVSFRKSGVDGLRNMRTILVPAVLGIVAGVIRYQSAGRRDVRDNFWVFAGPDHFADYF